MSALVDMSEIFDLIRALEVVAKAPQVEAERSMRSIVSKIADEARANAGGYPHGTGALSRSVVSEVQANGGHVYADPREGFFLEFGSPKTGAPRPWLTEPAERGAEELGKSMTKAIDVWGSL